MYTLHSIICYMCMYTCACTHVHVGYELLHYVHIPVISKQKTYIVNSALLLVRIGNMLNFENFKNIFY